MDKRTDDKTSSDFAVGYKKPPKATRFKKGKSGNVKGRPKGSRNLVALINEELDRIVTLQEKGRAVQLTKREALAKRLVNQGLNGEARAMAALINMDQHRADEEGSENELSPDDREQFERFKERVATAKSRSKTRKLAKSKPTAQSSEPL